ncbi:2-oxoglutarate-Fe(II) type oxidoreductase hxnY [Mangifera indica]|uniref:2-oxoglutarate-Fe(II) type oxidoreductase hxnY n=1 Tax=Mangifera indica TaxID=29780 RepID=UPI001CFAE180|nr:2-oxoglutarate-Fe(II) type oxidoreductase hxnY [Mangifera indica]
MEALKLPIIDLSSADRFSAAQSIRQACVEYGFFYLVNHGVDEELLGTMFDQSRKFFSLPLAHKMTLARKEHRGYTPLYAENLDPSSSSKGDSKESFYIGPLEGTLSSLNQWPSEEVLPSWRSTMDLFYKKVLDIGCRLIHLIALALELDEDFFEKVGALDMPSAFLRLIHYPGKLDLSGEEIYGASAHSDYGMITLLATDGIPGLQVCREKFKESRAWEEVPSIKGAFIVNIGDMMERWTNCLFRSTLHRVMPTGQERYSAAFFLDPNSNCVVECLESCCSESCPPRFPPIRSGDYFKERLRLTYGS